MVVRARICTSVDVDPNFADTMEDAQKRIAHVVREALAELGSVREVVRVNLELDDVEQLRDCDVFTDDRPFTY